MKFGGQKLSSVDLPLGFCSLAQQRPEDEEEALRRKAWRGAGRRERVGVEGVRGDPVKRRRGRRVRGYAM